MFSIINSNFESCHLTHLHQLFKGEWADFTPFMQSKDGYIVPAPIIALEGEKLLGGLAFTRYKVPCGECVGLWINAIFVKNDYRGKGIASKLIAKAVETSSRNNEGEIFALTDIPEMYLRVGWSVVNKDESGFVMKKKV